MSISTYEELKTAVANWLDREDLTDRIPEFIALAEAQIARSLRKQTVRTTISLASNVVALPSTCAELRSIRLNTTSYKHPIRIVTPETLAEYRSESQSVPRYGAVVGGVLLLDRVPDQSYDAEIVFYSALTPLSGSVPSNTTLQSAPDLYLWGALKEAAPYLVDDERVALWEAKFAKALSDEELARERAEYPSTLRPVRLPMVFG